MIIDFVEKPADPPPHARQARPRAGQHGHLHLQCALSSTRSWSATSPTRTRATTSARTSSRAPSRTARPWRTPSSSVPSARAMNEEPYWRDVGTIDAYWDANIDLTATDPLLNLYDTRWPIWTYQPQLPPAKFVHNQDDRRGMAIESLVSGGCIVSGPGVPLGAVLERACALVLERGLVGAAARRAGRPRCAAHARGGRPRLRDPRRHGDRRGSRRPMPSASTAPTTASRWSRARCSSQASRPA